MKKLILSLCLFCSILMYSQDRKEFAGVWQDINNEETVLVVYHDKIIKSLKFWNFRLCDQFNIKESFLYEKNGLVQTEYEDNVNNVKFITEYSLKDNILTKEANGMLQQFTKLN